MEGHVQTPPIVVGIDGSTASMAALAWAADAAALRRCPLHLVHVIDVQAFDADAKSIKNLAWADRQLARSGHPDLEVTMSERRGAPTTALLRASEGAALLVLGRRGTGQFAELIRLGSTALSCVTRSSTPTVIVPPQWHASPCPAPGNGSHLVVGVVGSSPCQAAIEFAFAEAIEHNLALTAMYASHPEEGNPLLSNALAGWREKFPDVAVTERVELTHPAAGLIRTATHAELLVVGACSHETATGLPLGSITQAILRYAACPIAVVPPPRGANVVTSPDLAEPITVGLDDSIAGLRALDWAAAEAWPAACPLRLVHAYQPATNRAPGLPASTRIFAYENGKRVLDAARHHLSTGPFSDLKIACVLNEGRPAKVLLDQTLLSRSRALVVGSRGLGIFTTIAVGSTSLACAARSMLPVFVVPRSWTIAQRRNGRVVVGVNPTGHCESALGYAFDHAQRHRFELLAVMCWELANPYARDASTRTEEFRSGRTRAEARLDAALAAWREKYPDVRVHTAPIHLQPVAALVEHSRDAELLVIGGRQPGLVRGRILSSIARGVLRHAEVPVAVVRG